MQYLNPIYAMVHLSGLKTLIQSQDIISYRKKSVKITFFQSWNSHTDPLFKDSKILESFDKTPFLLTYLTFVFNSSFHFSFESHFYKTRWENLGYLTIPLYQTKTYSRYSMAVNALYVWNYLESSHRVILHHLSTNKLKEIILSFPQQM